MNQVPVAGALPKRGIAHAILCVLACFPLACGEGDPVAPTEGSLAISTTGMAAGVTRNIGVAGPSGTFAVTTVDTVLRKLEPGTYTISSPTRWVETGRYVPDVEVQSAEVKASSQPTHVHVSYTLWDSRLTLNITGLPSSAAGDVGISGPSFTTTATQSQTFGDLRAGSYAITARDVIVNGITYRGTPVTQTVTLSTGITPTVANVSYAAATAKITFSAGVSPTGLPGGTTLATQDAGGEQYMINAAGSIYRIVRK